MTTSLTTFENSILSDDTSIGTHLGDKVVISELYLKTIRGDLISLIGKYNQINFFENMFSFSISGNISIKDTEGLLEKHAITGGEEIYIKVSKPKTNDIIIWRQDFVVHKISKSGIDVNLNTSYVLYFTTKSFISSIKRRLYKTFKNQKFTEAVKTIYSDISPNEIIIEDSSLTFKDPFVCPGLNPFKAIEYIAKRSCAKSKFFVFYERLSPITGTISGVPFASPHYFGSIQKLIEDSKTARQYTIIFQPKIQGMIEPSYGENVLRTPKFTRSTNFNHIEVMLTGFYNSKVTTIDPITRTFNLEKFGQANKSIEGDFYSNNLLPKNVTFSQYDDLKGDMPGERLIISQYNDPQGKEKWLSNNIQGQILVNLFKIEVLIEGGTNSLGVGNIVNFKTPSHYKKLLSPQNARIEDDIIYSGSYIVTAAKHTIVGDNYSKQLELSRGSLNADLNKEITVTSTTSNTQISSVTNKDPNSKSVAVRGDGQLETVKAAINDTTKSIKILGTTIELKRVNGSLSATSLNALSKLGISKAGNTYLSRSFVILAKSIKNKEFETIMEAVVNTYPNNLSVLTQSIYDSIKKSIEAQL